MEVARAWLTEVRGTMGAPVANSQGSWQIRESLVVNVEGIDGTIGRGEASPLPGYSSETLADCRTVLMDYCRTRHLPDPRSPAAARFALDMALLDLRSRSEQRPTWTLLSAEKPGTLSLCALLIADDDGIEEELNLAWERGYRSFKLKIGRDPSVDLQRCRWVRQCYPTAEIRLDANRAFRAEEATQRLAAFRELDCAFVEEPWSDLDLTRGGDEWLHRCASLPLPLALDESLRQPGAEAALRRLPGPLPLAALVLKPMALGGIEPVRRFAQLGRDRGVPVVLSHLLDGPLALSACWALAFAFGSSEVAAGLAPHRGLLAWNAAPLPSPTPGHVQPWHTWGLLP